MLSSYHKEVDVALTQDDVSAELFKQAISAGRVAVDTETTGLDWRTDRLCVVQVAVENGRIDLVRLTPATQRNRQLPTAKRLVALLSSNDVVAVFHHALFDLRFLCSRYDFTPVRIACTKVASKIADPDAPSHSLQDLLHRHLRISIAKDLTKSDWLSETLSPEQIRYAADDVRHITALWDALHRHLQDKGRLQLADNCLGFLPTLVQLHLMNAEDPFSY